MNYRTVLITALAVFGVIAGHAQNLSDLQGKRLNRIDDLGTSLESLIGRLGGKIEGNIDSVVVLADTEKQLRLQIYYTGYTSCFFTVSTMNGSRQREQQVIPAQFSQATVPSPVECVLILDDRTPKDALPSSPFLRIDISKREGNTGKVKIFELRKSWETDVAPQNVLINVMLQPVGVAASLNYNVPGDIMPSKKIIFEPQANFKKPPYNRIRKSSGSNAFGTGFNFSANALPLDLTGTWNNTDPNTTGLTSITVTNNVAQVFYKCGAQSCELGKSPLVVAAADAWRIYFNATKPGGAKTEIYLQLIKNDLRVEHKEITNRAFAGIITKTWSYVFRQAAVRLINVYTLAEFAILQPPAGQPTVPLGPDKNATINLWNEITVDNLVSFNRPQEISNININVFPDQNRNSGIYYIIPADYHLRWEAGSSSKKPEEGYDLNILYGTQTGGGAEPVTDAPVRMSARLTAGISNSERAFIKSMLKAIIPSFVDVQFLPLRENPSTTFQNTLNAQFGVPMDKITVITNTDLNNDINLAWRTNPDTKEFIQTALTSGEGISASVILKPKNDGIVDQQIPASISLADPRSLGKMVLEPAVWRTRGWRNTTPYPLQLKYLHVLKKEINGNKLIVYSWSLNNLEVPPLAQASFDHSRVPPWLDADPTAMFWLDYAVLECSDCDRKVMEAVTGGVFGSTTQQVKFTIAPAVFDTLKASYFMVYVRSKQADPKGETVKELGAVKITNDAAKEFFAGPLFLAPGGQLDYEYRITAASTDGDFYPSAQWIKASDKELLLGKTAMKEMFRGIIPEIN
ncbi:MAG: hypothetical protein ACT4OJ_04590 [Bacteroidota bacterium]